MSVWHDDNDAINAPSDSNINTNGITAATFNNYVLYISSMQRAADTKQFYIMD